MVRELSQKEVEHSGLPSGAVAPPCQVKSRPGSPAQVKGLGLEALPTELRFTSLSLGLLRRRGQPGWASAKGAMPAAKVTKRREGGEGAWEEGGTSGSAARQLSAPTRCSASSSCGRV